MYANSAILDGRNYPAEVVVTQLDTEGRALEFFYRAELSETLERIWASIKSLRLTVVLKVVKAIAVMAVFALLASSLTITGIIGLGAAVGGLLWAAISNVVIWIVYGPMLLLNPSNGMSSIVLAVLLAWLFGVGSLTALLIGAIILPGVNHLDKWTKNEKTVGDITEVVGRFLPQVDMASVVERAAGTVSGIVRNIVERSAGPAPSAQRKVIIPVS